MSVQGWVDRRVPTSVVHLDAAACGRPSREVLAAEIAHLQAEAEHGGYVAQARAESVVAAGRAALAAMVGLTGTDVCFLDSAGSAFATLLEAWSLPVGARIGLTAGEYGANARVLRRRARERGWELVALPLDGYGRVTDLPAGLDLVTFPHVASQRGSVQVSDAAQTDAARRSGISVAESVEKRRRTDRMLDLDRANAVLGQCPR